MSLKNHYPFAPFFSTRTPRVTVVRAARQLGKTQGLTARLLVRCAAIRGHKAAVILPLQEQADRVSDQFFRPMIEDSPLRHLLKEDAGAVKGSMRRRSFSNRAIINFGYASSSADRLRGLSIAEADIDEAQDFNPAFFPVVRECQSAYPEKVSLFTGTSKTEDTALNQQWAKSSQAVWHTKCSACGYDNRAILQDGDILKMLGPHRRGDISERRPGTVCASCQLPINPRYGRWVHRRPELAGECAGYHMPQLIFPLHFANELQWADLLAKRDGRVVGYNQARFYNEVLGEPYDLSLRLVAPEDLRRAAVLEENTLERAAARAARYELVVLGVDWGGGGESGGSQTRLAAVGLAADGGADVFYGAAVPFGMDAVEEAQEVFRVAARLGTTFVAHDFNGAGSAREAVLTHLDWPLERIAPIVYSDTPGAKTIRYHAAAGNRYRGFWHLSKPRSLQYMAQGLRRGRIRTFAYDYRGPEEPGLLHDWVNYVENRFTAPSGRSVYQVRAADETATTDFADAMNMACAFMWETSGAWPSLT